MNSEFSQQERDLLLELIDTAEKQTIHSIDHTDSRRFRDLLRIRMELLTALEKKIRVRDPHAA